MCFSYEINNMEYIESIDPYLDELYSLQTPNSYHITQDKYSEKYSFQ